MVTRPVFRHRPQQQQVVVSTSFKVIFSIATQMIVQKQFARNDHEIRDALQALVLQMQEGDGCDEARFWEHIKHLLLDNLEGNPEELRAVWRILEDNMDLFDRELCGLVHCLKEADDRLHQPLLGVDVEP